uniref:Uncharacterized protein n=1 Tax=Candidatus Kentrum sp. SD TaxID=2126332 RepID=A0A450YNT5_9GAMM|nr:MAG: hypothetical protein BECKSD772F_GA0070984_11398 [Candidatus Kentron sp. SD]VFK48813.1 MAG: hypothetical protein BECKSD772E_GA0070983_11438 [Candidatus Kentron sp. SD]VFK80629.1 MAG: hypothetical protein BECKSD772D_GA0070982_11348 [Candidatus Kentron sp. SD]
MSEDHNLELEAAIKKAVTASTIEAIEGIIKLIAESSAEIAAGGAPKEVIEKAIKENSEAMAAGGAEVSGTLASKAVQKTIKKWVAGKRMEDVKQQAVDLIGAVGVNESVDGEFRGEEIEKAADETIKAAEAAVKKMMKNNTNKNK